MFKSDTLKEQKPALKERHNGFYRRKKNNAKAESQNHKFREVCRGLASFLVLVRSKQR
jgi:hypothetical protein